MLLWRGSGEGRRICKKPTQKGRFLIYIVFAFIARSITLLVFSIYSVYEYFYCLDMI